jgi:hypothetical protein
MPDLTLYFDCDPGAESPSLQRELQAGLERLSGVKAADTSAPTTRFTGLEILAAITLAAQIVHVSRGMADDVAAIVNDVRSIVAELKAVFSSVAELAATLKVRQVRVPVGLEKKAITELTDEDYQRIAARVAAVNSAGPQKP